MEANELQNTFMQSLLQPLSELGLSVAQSRKAARKKGISTVQLPALPPSPGTTNRLLTPLIALTYFESSSLATSSPILSTHLPIQEAQRPQHPLPPPALAQPHREGKGALASFPTFPP